MQTLPVKEFRRLDLNSEEMGVPVMDLMDRAGKALADAAAAMAPTGRIVLLCGKGNNGGDGYAACAHLQAAGRDVVCVALESPTGVESRHYHDRCHGVVSWTDFDPADDSGLVVDCLLGSGIIGEPRPPYDGAIDWLNAQPKVLACDIPSAFQVRADTTVTFHAAKEGITKENSGRIIVADIGIPPEAADRVGFGDLDVAYPRPGSDAHKGDHGRLLIVGGGPFTGAPYYASVGAYRTGVDLALVYAPHAAAEHIRGYGPEPIVHDAGDGNHLDAGGARIIIDAMGKVDALVIGPGLGTHPDTIAAAGDILAAATDRELPVVIDADGLDAVTEEYLQANGHRTVLTPHAQEFRDLTGRDDADEATVASYAKQHGVIVVRKGSIDVIASPERVKTCHRGHPCMTVGGTGDVLAGSIGALLAMGADAFDAACAGTYLVTVAGERAGEELSMGATALDVADHIPEVLARLG